MLLLLFVQIVKLVRSDIRRQSEENNYLSKHGTAKKGGGEKNRLDDVPLALPGLPKITNPRNWTRDLSITDAQFNH